jgi:DNA invertase Pin-like site-specific DNA recombinase
MKYGYMRVSTLDKQEFTRQEFLLKDYNLDRIFEEKISGTKKACGREEFGKLVDCLKKGDEIYFESMSRMARSMQDLIDTTNFLVKEKRVKVIFLKENLTIGGDNGDLDAMGALVFNIMGAFAQFERDMIADRTKMALRAKREADPNFQIGRASKITAEIRKEVIAELQNGGTVRGVAERFGLSASAVQRVKKGALV